MKIKELKNKIVLAELDSKAAYIMLFNKSLVPFEFIRDLRIPSNIFIYIIPTDDVDKAIKFVEIPNKNEKP